MKKTGFFYPQKMGHIILQAMEEVLGCNEAQAVLQAASLNFPLDNSLPSSLEPAFPFHLHLLNTPEF